MVLRRLLYRRKPLIWVLVINIVLFGVIILVQLDGRYLMKRKTPDQKAYERWLNIRNNWESYTPKQRIHIKSAAGYDAAHANGVRKKQGLQLDAVAGFDFFDRSNDARKHLKSNSVDLSIYDLTQPLNFIPPVPNFSESDIVPFLNDNITREFLTLPEMEYTAKIVIATPACDVAGDLERFTGLISELTYPHHLVSLYFGEDSSSDRTYDMALLVADDLENKHGFHAASAFHFNISGGVHGSWGDVHERTSQHERRSHIAKSRNLLLDVILHMKEKFDYVLWIDSDISELPMDVIQQLLSAKQDVVVPACLFRQDDIKRNFDKNSWQETAASREDLAQLPKTVLLVEGYTPTFRLYLPDLRAKGRVVPLDGVGGCTLLVRAGCHRYGLLFPEEVYNNHIETEGLAKMARDMGYSVAGMPFVEVFH